MELPVCGTLVEPSLVLCGNTKVEIVRSPRVLVLVDTMGVTEEDMRVEERGGNVVVVSRVVVGAAASVEWLDVDIVVVPGPSDVEGRVPTPPSSSESSSSDDSSSENSSAGDSSSTGTTAAVVSSFSLSSARRGI